MPCSWLAASPPSLDAPSPQMLLSRPRIGLTLTHGSSAPSTPVTSPISKERRSRSTARCSATPPSQRQADSVERCMSTATAPCASCPKPPSPAGIFPSRPGSGWTAIRRNRRTSSAGRLAPASRQPASPPPRALPCWSTRRAHCTWKRPTAPTGRPRGRAARPARCRSGGGSTWPG